MNILDQSFLLIISGADRTGKDWLAEKLHKRLYATYMTLMKPMHVFEGGAMEHGEWLTAWKAQMAELLAWYQANLEEKRPTRFIVDRLFPDEWAYARAMNRSTYTDEVFAWIDQSFGESKAKWLLCVEDLDVIKSRWDDTPEKLALMSQVQFNFWHYRLQTTMEKLVVSTLEPGVVDTVVQWVLRGC